MVFLVFYQKTLALWLFLWYSIIRWWNGWL